MGYHNDCVLKVDQELFQPCDRIQIQVVGRLVKKKGERAMSENMNETMNENEGVTVTLTLDNDETLECAVLTIYEAAGRQYIALLPLDENGEESEESDVYIYRFSETEDGEPNLENIEDDDEYDAAADKFDEWMDSLEFDEIDLDAE